MTDKLLILTTAGSESEAKRIAQMLVERRLAACVNIVPKILSVYRWEGKMESAEEYLLIAKTTRDKEVEVQAAIRELHSYELPECISIPIESASPEYLKWITDSLQRRS
jgi:periplasmic divalent cation tolerance protein